MLHTNKVCSSLVCLFVDWTLSLAHTLIFKPNLVMLFYFFLYIHLVVLPRTNTHKYLTIKRLWVCIFVAFAAAKKKFHSYSLLHSFSLHFYLICLFLFGFNLCAYVFVLCCVYKFPVTTLLMCVVSVCFVYIAYFINAIRAQVSGAQLEHTKKKEST